MERYEGVIPLLFLFFYFFIFYFFIFLFFYFFIFFRCLTSKIKLDISFLNYYNIITIKNKKKVLKPEGGLVMENKGNVKKIIAYIIGDFLAHIAFPAALFTIVWNGTVADTFNAAHFNYWTFFIVCVGIHCLFSHNAE